MGLNEPLAWRYLTWIAGLAHGDFGISYTYKVPTAELIGQRLWVSLPLAVYALVLSTLIALPVGIIAAAKRNTAADYGIMASLNLESRCRTSGSPCCWSCCFP